MKHFLILFLLFLQTTTPIFAQLLTDEPTQTEIKKGLDKLYNLEFDAAESYFKPIKAKYHNHPLAYLLEAIQLQWKYLPIENNPTAFKQYTLQLQNCKQKAEILLKQPTYKAEATFFLLAAHGYIALSSNYTKDYAKAVNEARLAYSYLKDGFKLTKENPDFYYTTGIYNYYRVQYPLTHPIVKPLVTFFENGNKILGKQQLAIASTKSTFSRMEALMVLGNIHLKYEKDFAAGLHYTGALFKKYPNNYTFRIRYTEALLFTNKFDEANTQIASLANKGGTVNALASDFFSGYEAEFNQKNDKLAAKFYAETLKHKPDSRYTEEYYAMACLGMGRIMQRINDNEKARFFYKKCLEHAQYTWVVNDATSKLKSL